MVCEREAALIERHAPLLPHAAVERQRDELMLIFATPRAAQGLRLLDSLGLLRRVLPELDVTRDVEQPKEHHFDVFASLPCDEPQRYQCGVGHRVIELPHDQR